MLQVGFDHRTGNGIERDDSFLIAFADAAAIAFLKMNVTERDSTNFGGSTSRRVHQGQQGAVT